MSMLEIGARSALSPSEILGIFKPRIAISIMLSALGGLAITPGRLPAPIEVTVLAVAVFLAAGAAGGFNQWAEADLDARMERTAGRPFASGRAERSMGWLAVIVAILALAFAMAWMATNAWAAVYTLLGTLTYAVVYTLWLKQRTWMNIVVGGLAGSFAVLAGAAAVNASLAPEPLLLALVLFLWTPPHFWSLAIAARKDYAANGVPMLPLVIGNKPCAWIILGHAFALCGISLLPALYASSVIYLVPAVIGGCLFVATSVALVVRPDAKHAIYNFLISLLQLLLLLTGAILDRWLSGGFT
ncbi:MAG: protoheme IX farnesyltransferase [Hyphomicrobiales bacterium]|nr:MAG: protoheme IX farnesyltransferase [Hyphomicrobiales bacterium]